MGVSSLHPSITPQRLAEWQVMRDTMAGQEHIKAKAERYLPMPGGFRAQPDGGQAAYQAYRKRSDFPEIVAPAIAAMVGIVHSKESQIEMPDAMMGIWENADGHGLTLEAFHRRITRNLLLMGRYAVLADAPMGGGDPYLTGYSAEAVINWDRDWFVLDESEMVRDGFTWDFVNRYRVVELVDGRYVATLYDGDSGAVEVVTPTMQGGGALELVPLAIGNARDLVPDAETPPLIGVGNAAVSIYQLSADYRHQLYMSGQETLVAINGPAPEAVGAGVVHQMDGNGDLPPDLKYVSPSCAGIDAHKEAMQEQRRSAAEAGARMFDQGERAQESGEARRLRFAAETASIMSVALVSAGLLERGLRYIAMMRGVDPSQVVVTPPADLMDTTMSPQDYAALFAVYERGGMSWDTFYEAGRKGGIMSAERDAEQEFALIDGHSMADDAF